MKLLEKFKELYIYQKTFIPFCFSFYCFFWRNLNLFPPIPPGHNVELLQQWFVSLNTDYPLQATLISHSMERQRSKCYSTHRTFLLTHL